VAVVDTGFPTEVGVGIAWMALSLWKQNSSRSLQLGRVNQNHFLWEVAAVVGREYVADETHVDLFVDDYVARHGYLVDQGSWRHWSP
jgi:hypothetical protein